jgi:3-methyladenine DNA glycosylase AlkC
MGIKKKVLELNLNSEHKLQSPHVAVMFDEHGKEVKITTYMVQHTCMQLLKRCRRSTT